MCIRFLVYLRVRLCACSTLFKFAGFCLLLATSGFSTQVIASPSTSIELPLDSDTELSIQVYHASGEYRLLWIPGYATPLSAVEQVAAQLVDLNIEVWHADLLEARFLPKSASNIYKIPEKDIIAIINQASLRNDGKKLFIHAESRATIPVLLALREIQTTGKKLENFGGVILSSPYFYVETPDPGESAQLMPIVSATNLPLYIIQPKNSPRYWQLQQTVPALEKAGSDVFIQVLADIRGRFLFRPDSTVQEIDLTQKFGQLLARGIKLLETINQKSRLSATQKIETIRKAGGKKDRYLQVYKGNPQPPALKLKNLAGNTIDLKKYINRVVLVNFWASWCPPCVEEMPSLQRLSEKLPEDDFIILGVNIAESRTLIEKFLSEQIKIDFPVLLDLDGEVMRQWNVMAFPTSFVIDKQGKIRYALFGSIDWDTPEINKTIKKLVEE